MYGDVHLKIGIFFEIFVIVRQDNPVAAVRGQMKFAVRIDQYIFFFQYIEFFVADTVPEHAYLGYVFVDAGAFDVEKNVVHISRS